MSHHPPSGLQHVLTQHMLGISRLTLEAQDSVLDISREVAFFVETGYWEYLAKDPAFVDLWNQRHELRNSVPAGLSLQEANYRFDLALYGLACSHYTRQGLLAQRGWEILTADDEAAEDIHGG